MLQISAAGRPADDYDWFWFIYESENSLMSNYTAYRPLYYRHSDKKTGAVYTNSLPPVIFRQYQRESSTDTQALFGLFSSVDYTRESGISDYDLNLFPFLYLGLSENEADRYFMLWPFGGTIKGKFALEQIDAYIFPGVLLFWFYPPSSLFSWTAAGYALASFVPVYASYSRKEYRARALFWPIVQKGSAPGIDEFRIMPFYARNTKINWYDNYSILMLINYQTWYFTNDTRRTLFVFPFFGRKWSDSGRVSSYTILWPFFSWGYDKKNGDYQYNLPWPLVQIRDSENPKVRKRIYFPFYGEYSSAGGNTRFITPFYFNLNRKLSSGTSDYHVWGLVLYWHFQREYTSPDPYYGTLWKYRKLWPLFSYEKTDKGLFALNFLSLLPFRDTEGYEAVYGPLWTLFEYKELPDGEKRLGFLLRTYYQRWGNNYFDMKIPFVVSYRRYGTAEIALKLLYPLFEYRVNKKEKKVKIAGLPVWRSDVSQMPDSGGYDGADPQDLKSINYLRPPHLDDFREMEAGSRTTAFRF